MARCCGSTGTCACKIVSGRNIEVTGTGTSQDPFVVASTTSLNVESNNQFALAITGAGTLESPWLLTIDYAPSASLDNLPDVEAPAPANGNVLAWSDADQAWVPAPPTTAAAGGNLTGNGIEGDGSAGAPLEVTAAPTRYITVEADGVGLSDEAINRLVRVFPTATDRAAADPAPLVGSLSMVEADPGRIDYWTGAAWSPIDAGLALAVQPGEMLALSGSYNGGGVFNWIDQISVTTDTNGDFDVISAADLAAYSGVLAATVQETGLLAWKCVVRAEAGRIVGRAFRIDDGTPYGGYAITATVSAMLY